MEVRAATRDVNARSLHSLQSRCAYVLDRVRRDGALRAYKKGMNKEAGLPPREAMRRFEEYLGDNPFGFKAVCASSWFEGRGKTFKVDLPHRAVEDAAIQLRHFFDQG